LSIFREGEKKSKKPDQIPVTDCTDRDKERSMTFILASIFRPALREHSKICRPNHPIFGVTLLARPALTRVDAAPGDASAVAIDATTGAVYSASTVIRRAASKEIWRANLGLSPQDMVLSLTSGIRQSLRSSDILLHLSLPCRICAGPEGLCAARFTFDKLS
jgi:hypothetical protein